MEANKKSFTGRVVSDKMDKTIVVAVSSRRLHPLYKKYVTTTKKVKAHDERNEAKIALANRRETIWYRCRPI